MGERFRPRPTPETRHFWQGTKKGELRLQCCAACGGTYFPPRPFCPKCNSDDITVVAASGRGTLYSYVISHQPAPGFEPPFAIAVVELEEGPRLMSNLVDCPQTPDVLDLDMPLEAVFQKQDEDITLVLFRPAGGAA